MSASSPSAQWTRHSERGSLPLIHLMVWLSLCLGRNLSRVLLHIIAGYFYITGGSQRRASREFLTCSLGRAPTLAEQYRLLFHFAATLHDRIYFLKGRFELFDIEVHGAQLFEPEGMLLMGAHLGSFEVLRACGRHLGNRRVTMAMYKENARRINSVLGAIDPAAMADVVALGSAGSMLQLAARLDEGGLVGLLADRTLGDEAVTTIEFLGRPALFPTGPMRMAAALRRRVIFMACLYRGGNRYEIRIEPLADFSGIESLSREERDLRVREATEAYARHVERCAREAPDNWFNFHDFWGRAG